MDTTSKLYPPNQNYQKPKGDKKGKGDKKRKLQTLNKKRKKRRHRLQTLNEKSKELEKPLNCESKKGKLQPTSEAKQDSKSNEFSALIESIEAFVETTQQNDTGMKREQWLRFILANCDRYGYGNWIKEHKDKSIIQICNKVKKAMKLIRSHLSQQRQTGERVQAQIPLGGLSMIVFLVNSELEFNIPLLKLLALAHDEHCGLSSIRSPNKVPALLHKSLQDKIPQKHQPGEIRVSASKVTKFLRRLVYAYNHLNQADEEVRKFFEDNNLEARWSKLELPTNKNKVNMELVCPEPRRDQMILWWGFHCTAGASTKEPNIVAFVDLVPDHLLEVGMSEFIAFAKRHANPDFGDGSGRGSFESTRYLERIDSKRPPFAVPTTTAQLTPEQIQLFHQQGYLCIDLPPAIYEAFQKLEPRKEIEEFLSCVFDRKIDLNDCREIVDEKVARTEYNNPYAFYRHRSPKGAPLNLIDRGILSHNAQSGGKYITAQCGMGPGTTHSIQAMRMLEQTPWLQQVFLKLMKLTLDTPLTIIPERFRIKFDAVWSALHVDLRMAHLLTL